MDASTSITFINKICFCLKFSADGTAMKAPAREGSKNVKENQFHINKQACKYFLFIITNLHLPPAHTDTVLKLQHKWFTSWMRPCGSMHYALIWRFCRGQVWYHLKRREKPYKVCPLEIHTPTELQKKRRKETEILFYVSGVVGMVLEI